ncbi:hypothetical protein [Deinococcus peraridilitoris]|uniref:Uncharacterized protein n=1 Tax=Deinococcus peraridilitoris (strain DSM 19664 / LMG 22246 / CIP 109416 / KR-200) TaxID=937777 RepID=L0A3X6_DEIPD|nr:hypothetical protein [Deinococcus peraridilitoris]AFZ68556.1 hypothetical protein Deipe_3110 [Deinococcus peraridilitoris DSM 19664]
MKRNLLETLNAPITGEDVKRVLATPVFVRKDGGAASGPAGSRLLVREHMQGPQLTSFALRELGATVTLLRLTFEQPVELIEMLEPGEGSTFTARLWNADGWPVEVQLHLERFPERGPLVLKDIVGRDVHFTLIARSTRACLELTLQVVRLPLQGDEETSLPPLN